MRQLVASGQATYGDKTDGKYVKLGLRATKTGLNWYTIAKLHTVAGSTDVITADRMKLRFTLVNAKVMCDVIASLNILAPDNNFDVDVLSYNGPIGYTPYANYDGLAALNRPQMRVIYNKTSGSLSGAYLQVGIHLPTLAEV